MRDSVLYVICGVPGSGKSTYIENLMMNIEKLTMKAKNDILWVSRDEIRYSLFGGVENVTLDNYYSKENQVRANFYEIINKGLMAGYDNVFADATHLTPASRKGLLKRIYAHHKENIAIVMTTPLPICLERNETREGIRKVPSAIIRKMWDSFQAPTCDEGFSKIIYIDKDGNIENIVQ